VILWKKNKTNYDLLFAGAICLTIWISPHAMIYDWSLLLIPAILLWQIPYNHEFIRPLFIAIWISTFIGDSLTRLQLHYFPIAIQINIPILFMVCFTFLRYYEANMQPVSGEEMKIQAPGRNLSSILLL
jgi:hypothetical protein